MARNLNSTIKFSSNDRVFISASGYSSEELAVIRRFANALRDFPFLVMDTSLVEFAMVLVRLRVRRASQLTAPE